LAKIRAACAFRGRIVVVTASLLTLMLGVLAALGVFNTVVLNTRERRRDLGMLKSIGMPPPGRSPGCGAGDGAGRKVDFPAVMLRVYSVPLAVLLRLAGVAIAALGAYVPDRSAARTTIADVLPNE
jgi:putative ABC transport system permease protein